MHNENRQLRPWVCTCCGKREMSKGGNSRSFSNPFSKLAWMLNICCARVIPDPSRKAREELVFQRDFRTAFSRVSDGRDVQLRITINDDMERSVKNGEIERPDDAHSALRRFFKLARDMTELEIEQTVCSLLHEHRWSDRQADLDAMALKFPTTQRELADA